MDNNRNKVFDTFSKASHYALWLDFKYRADYVNFVVCKIGEECFIVCEHEKAKQQNLNIIIPLAHILKDISDQDISTIAKDTEPLSFWENIRGTFSILDNEVLMFVLDYNIPLELFIRYELACRGVDKDNRWIGFDKAENVWLE